MIRADPNQLLDSSYISATLPGMNDQFHRHCSCLHESDDWGHRSRDNDAAPENEHPVRVERLRTPSPAPRVRRSRLRGQRERQQR